MLRRAGIAIATSQAIDCARAARAVGLSDRQRVKEALACLVVHDLRDRARFDAAFDAFFAQKEARTLWERLSAKGFDERQLEVLRQLLADVARAGADGDRLTALLGRGADLDRLLHLAGVTQALDSMTSELQAG